MKVEESILFSGKEWPGMSGYQMSAGGAYGNPVVLT